MIEGAIDLALMIVGTPRSGTTLVQRTAADACGLGTVPETHMFTVFAPRLLRRTSFPLEGPELRSELAAYTALQQHRGGAPDTDVLYDRLDGRAETIVDIFLAVLAEQSGGAARIVEKTPDHLLWVRHLAPALPTTRFVAVIRDPRAVFASTRQVHWGQQRAVMAAERWALDQRRLLRAQASIGPQRLVLLRYEDLVAAPDEAEALLRTLVGRGGASDASTIDASNVFRAHETAWKGRATQPATEQRVRAWESELAADDIAAIELIANEEMAVFGYEPSQATTGNLGWRRHLDRQRYRLRRQAHEWRIDHRYVPRSGL